MSILNKWHGLQVAWKWRILFAGIAIILLAAYQFNFRRTAAVIREYRELSAFADTMPDIGIMLQENTRPLENPAQRAANSETILHNISAFCEENEISIKEIVQSSYKDSDNYFIETNRITLTGTYQNMLRLLYDIEKRQKLVTLNAVHWEMQKDKITSEYFLFATLYIKQIKNENEKS